MSLVNDVLQVSKLESGRPATVEEPFDLHDTLEDCITILSSQAEERGICLELETSGLRHNRVIGNPLHMKQILMNVIDNALKYNRPHGSVFVRAKETAFRDGWANCQFVIEDTGIGIGEDFKEHIFEPFMQEHQDARTNYSGVGLGMSIVKKLVEEMKGTVLPCPFGLTRRGADRLRMRSRMSRTVLPGCTCFWWRIMRSTVKSWSIFYRRQVRR